MALTQPSGRAEQKICCAGVVVFRVNEGFTGHAERAHREGAAALVRALQCEGRPEQGKAGPFSRQELHACAGVWPAGAWARAPAHPIVYPSPPTHVWLHSRAQGPRPAACRAARSRRGMCWMCFTYTCLSEHFPRNRGTRRRYSLHTTPVHGGKYGYFVRFFARLAPAERRAECRWRGR